ncbi:MAG: efflux RND transporter periplasmic adaptor subunit [Planctomycetota bacterium]
MRRPLFVLALAATTALLPGVVPPPAQEGPPPTPVRAVRAEVRSVVQRESVSGNLRTASDADLAAREDGAVEAFEVREGDVVERGAVLARLDARRLEANRAMTVAMAAEAEATRIRWEAEVEDAELDAAALEKARGGDAISERELRQARTRLKVSRASALAAVKREEALAAELLLLDIRVNDMTIRAPFDGVIVERHVEVGEWVMPGDPVLTLVSVSRLEVWLDVPQRLAERIDSARSSMLVSAGADRLQVVATEPKVVPRVDPRSRMFSLVARIEGESARGLAPGMSASAYIPVGKEQDTLMLPKDALVYRPGGTGVMVVMGQDEGGENVIGVAALMPVTVLFETDRDVAIAPGAVQPGAAVVVEGNERLFPGTPVAATVDAKSPKPIDGQ